MGHKSEHSHRSTCPLACALDLIGDHWTILIIRDMLFANRHEYKDMLNAGEGIASNILSDRLRKLEEHELISSIPHPESGRRKLYYLLPKGKALITVLTHLARWAEQHLPHVAIPDEIRRLLIQDPDAFIKHVMTQLDEWEEAYLPATRRA